MIIAIVIITVTVIVIIITSSPMALGRIVVDKHMLILRC